MSHGVSANLCDALANLAKKGEGIEIDLFWAPVRPSTIGEHRFQFSENLSADILTEAARSFRRNEPLLDETVVAQVVALAREPREFDGRATILYVQDGHPIRLNVQFEESSYTTVIRAFENRNPISLDGDIYRIGSGYELRNPRNLTSVVTANLWAPMTLTESDVEHAALDWLEGLGWRTVHSPDIGPEGLNSERADYSQVMLERRIQDALLPKLVS